MTAPDDEPDLSAAELALGVLDGEERSAALRRVLADPAFAHEVERWRHRFTAFFAEVPAVEPRAGLGDRVASLADDGSRAARPWRIATALAALAAAILLAVVVMRPGQRPVGAPPAARPALLVAVLTPANAAPFAAAFDPATREIRLRGGIATAAGHDAELWAIGADGVPHAVGLLTGPHDTRLAASRAIAVTVGTTLAVSIEPAGGSPKPTPTGPVVASGSLVSI